MTCGPSTSPRVGRRPAPIREQVAGVDDVVLAFNADFFDINDTGGAEGVAVADGELVKSADTGSANVIGFDADGRGSIRSIGFTGTADTGAAVLDLHGLNTTELPVDGIGVYTSAWGEASRARVTDGAPSSSRSPLRTASSPRRPTPRRPVPSPRARSPSSGARPGPGRWPASRSAMRSLSTTSPVLDGELPQTAVSGRQILVEDGQVVHHEDQTRHPRTAVGLSEDGTTLFAVTVDGRQAASGGYTLDELARELLALGAHSALNLDGGGSSTLLARAPGEQPAVVNQPSDGAERDWCPTGWAWTVAPGSGRLTGLAVEPRTDADESP